MEQLKVGLLSEDVFSISLVESLVESVLEDGRAISSGFDLPDDLLKAQGDSTLLVLVVHYPAADLIPAGVPSGQHLSSSAEDVIVRSRLFRHAGSKLMKGLCQCFTQHLPVIYYRVKETSSSLCKYS